MNNIESTTRKLEISCDPSRLDFDEIFLYLSEQSYWAKGIPAEVVKRSIKNSLCFGAYIDGRQIAFARVITDYATFGYLADVFVVTKYRGQGIAGELMKNIMAHSKLQQLRRILLVTRDAHSLYANYGFEPIPQDNKMMQFHRPEIYS